MDGKQHQQQWTFVALPVPAAPLTFLVLEPELLLDFLAGEVDGAAELGAVQGLRDVVRAELLDEGEQLLPAAVLVQDLQDVCEACGREAGGGQVAQAGLPATAQEKGTQQIPCSRQTSPCRGAKCSSSSLAYMILWNPQPAMDLGCGSGILL